MSVALRVRELSVRFGGLTAVDQATLTIEEGEIRGLIGPNGAGKTTFFNAISGLVTPSAGAIEFQGKNIVPMRADARAARGIRRTFQTLQLVQSMTVLENVMFGLHSKISNGWLGLGLGRQGDRMSESAAIAWTEEVLDYLGIGGLILQEVATLSFAEQRYVELARALVARPKLLMLDEPAAGLTPSQVDELNRLLSRLRTDWKVTILLVEHVISLVVTLCDRITVLDRGRIIAEGTGAEILENVAVREAYLGEDADAYRQ